MTIPRLLYSCDFPPANRGGGDTLLMRLLGGYPTEELGIFTSKRRNRDLADGPFQKCRSQSFPELTGAKLHGMGRIAMLLDRMLIPLMALVILRIIRRDKVDVVLTVAHGYYFIAATLAARIVGVPIILIVHDDWVEMNKVVYVFRRFSTPIFQWVLSSASVVYVVSEPMRQHLLEKFGVSSKVQYPGTFLNPYADQKAEAESNDLAPLKIFYGGMIYHTVRDSIYFLADTVKAMNALHTLTRPVEVHFYGNVSDADRSSLTAGSESIKIHGWLGQGELQKTLAEADILFLPVGFVESAEYYARTSFPSKFADYLAASRPILVLAPENAFIVQYAREHNCAAVVVEQDQSQLWDAIKSLAGRTVQTVELARSSLLTFYKNHSVESQRQEFVSCLAQLLGNAKL